MATSEEILNIIKAHLYLDSGQSTLTDLIIRMHISEACKNIAASEYWLDTLQMTIANANSEGQLELPEKAVIHQAYFSSDTDAVANSKSWRRLTPIDYSYFLRQEKTFDSGFYQYPTQSFMRRYSVIPNTSDRNKTLIQVLDYPESTTRLMISYFPRNPDPTAFPDDFKMAIVLEAIGTLTPFIKAEATKAFSDSIINTTKKSLMSQKKLNNKVEYDDVDIIDSEKDHNYMKSDILYWTSGNYWY